MIVEIESWVKNKLHNLNMLYFMLIVYLTAQYLQETCVEIMFHYKSLSSRISQTPEQILKLPSVYLEYLKRSVEK